MDTINIPVFDKSETYSMLENGAVLRGSDGAYIPNDPANSDWRAFEAWREAGGEATPYVEPPSAPIEISAH